MQTYSLDFNTYKKIFVGGGLDNNAFLKNDNKKKKVTKQF